MAIYWFCIICREDYPGECPLHESICSTCKPLPCDSCGGMGWIDIGDCEDGVIDDCPTCDGTGENHNVD